MNDLKLYKQDFFGWANTQASLLRQGRLEHVDAENIAEELEGLAKAERRELKSRLRVLLMHLLKWDKQPEKRCGSWRGTIREQRLRIQDLLEDSPSLKSTVGEAFSAIEFDAIQLAADETGLSTEAFFGVHYPLDDILDIDFLPGEPDTDSQLSTGVL